MKEVKAEDVDREPYTDTRQLRRDEIARLSDSVPLSLRDLAAVITYRVAPGHLLDGTAPADPKNLTRGTIAFLGSVLTETVAMLTAFEEDADNANVVSMGQGLVRIVETIGHPHPCPVACQYLAGVMARATMDSLKTVSQIEDLVRQGVRRDHAERIVQAGVESDLSDKYGPDWKE